MFNFPIFYFQKAKLLRQKKEDGNAAFKGNKLNEAYTLYTEALAIDPCNKFTNAKLFFNRATVAAKVYFILIVIFWIQWYSFIVNKFTLKNNLSMIPNARSHELRNAC